MVQRLGADFFFCSPKLKTSYPRWGFGSATHLQVTERSFVSKTWLYSSYELNQSLLLHETVPLLRTSNFLPITTLQIVRTSNFLPITTLPNRPHLNLLLLLFQIVRISIFCYCSSKSSASQYSVTALPNRPHLNILPVTALLHRSYNITVRQHRTWTAREVRSTCLINTLLSLLTRTPICTLLSLWSRTPTIQSTTKRHQTTPPRWITARNTSFSTTHSSRRVAKPKGSRAAGTETP
ncbi:hypothetical protein BDR22DRAFT_514833 [Usnea florida]